MPPKILGLTGSVQMGKIQLTSVFEQLGWKFVDLNDVIYNNRLLGMPDRARVERIYQDYYRGAYDLFDVEGVENWGYYYFLQNRAQFNKVFEPYPAQVLRAAQQTCTELRGGEKLVLSWEYLPRIAKQLPLEHMLVFQSNTDVWVRRVVSRLRELATDIPYNKYNIEEGASDLRLLPGMITDAARVAMGDKCTLVDTSADDWGEVNLRAVLAHLG